MLSPCQMKPALNILIVEDVETVRHAVSGVLKTKGQGLVNVIPSGSVAEGIRTAKEANPNAILLDLSLPDAEGVEAVHKFQDEFPNIPIIVFSGDDRPELIEECIHAGAENFVTKASIKSEALLEVIRNAVVRHNVRKDFKPITECKNDLADTIREMKQFNESLGKGTS